MEAYGDDIGPALEDMDQSISRSLEEFKNIGYGTPEEWMNTMDRAMTDAANASDISAGGKKAIDMLLKGMEPNQEQMAALVEQYKKAGGDMADAQMKGISEAMDEVVSLKGVTGKKDSIGAMIAREAAKDTTMATALMASNNAGAAYANSVIAEIQRKCPEAEQEARDFLNAVRKEFENGMDPITVSIPVTVDMVETYKKSANPYRPHDIPKHGDGGIFNTRHIAEVAEEGPESIIPIDQSPHAIELWRETGKLLGAYEENNYGKMYEGIMRSGGITTDSRTSSFSPTFSPVIYVEGGPDVREQVMSGLENGFEWFKQMMEKYEYERFRAEY